MIKNKKPFEFMQKINYLSKFLFGIIVIIAFINSFITLILIINQGKNDKLWAITSNYIKANQGTT